jgi:hypothetical protein
MVLQTCTYEFLWYTSSHSSLVYLGMEILCPISNSRNFDNLLSHHFIFPAEMNESSDISTSLPRLGIFCFFNFNHPGKCKNDHIVVLMCISQMTNDVEHFLIFLDHLPSCAFDIISKKLLSNLMSQILSPTFLSKNFFLYLW